MDYHQYLKNKDGSSSSRVTELPDTAQSKAYFEPEEYQILSFRRQQLFLEAALLYYLSFLIRKTFAARYKIIPNNIYFDLLAPVTYLWQYGKKFQQIRQSQDQNQLYESLLYTSQKQKYISQHNMQFWSNSQYWH